MLDQAIARFLGHFRYIQGAARNTIMAYQTDLRQFRNVLRRSQGHAVDVNEIGQVDLQPFFDWIEEQQYRPATISRKLAAIRSFLNYLETEESVETGRLARGLRLPAPDRRAPRALNRNQIDRLLSAPARSTSARDIRDAAILALLYATGLRAAEAVDLTLADLDLQHGKLLVGESDRPSLPLGVAHHALERYVKEGRPQLLSGRDERALFVNQRGGGLSRQGLWLVVKKWANNCDLGRHVSPYTLRHSLTRHMLQAGRSRREVQTVLGLASPSSVQAHIQAGAAG